MTPACGGCRFAEVNITDDDDGDAEPVLECHRFPPTALIDADGAPWATFVQVDAGWWCAEFRPTPEEADHGR